MGRRGAAALIAAIWLTAGCSSDTSSGPATAEDSSATSTPTKSTPAGEPEECLAVAEEWLALYDALDQASTLEDPTKGASTKVYDDSAELLIEARRECSRLFADDISNAHDRMGRVDATITACEFVAPEMCGTRVDDALDRTMEAVDVVRAQVE